MDMHQRDQSTASSRCASMNIYNPACSPSKSNDALLLSRATSTATVAARSILLSGGSEQTALKTAKAAAQSVLKPQSSEATVFLKRRKARRQAEIVASMALISAANSVTNGQGQNGSIHISQTDWEGMTLHSIGDHTASSFTATTMAKQSMQPDHHSRNPGVTPRPTTTVGIGVIQDDPSVLSGWSSSRSQKMLSNSPSVNAETASHAGISKPPRTNGGAMHMYQTNSTATSKTMSSSASMSSASRGNGEQPILVVHPDADEHTQQMHRVHLNDIHESDRVDQDARAQVLLDVRDDLESIPAQRSRSSVMRKGKSENKDLASPRVKTISDSADRDRRRRKSHNDRREKPTKRELIYSEDQDEDPIYSSRSQEDDDSDDDLSHDQTHSSTIHSDDEFGVFSSKFEDDGASILTGLSSGDVGDGLSRGTASGTRESCVNNQEETILQDQNATGEKLGGSFFDPMFQGFARAFSCGISDNSDKRVDAFFAGGMRAAPDRDISENNSYTSSFASEADDTYADTEIIIPPSRRGDQTRQAQRRNTLSHFVSKPSASDDSGDIFDELNRSYSNEELTAKRSSTTEMKAHVDSSTRPLAGASTTPRVLSNKLDASKSPHSSGGKIAGSWVNNQLRQEDANPHNRAVSSNVQQCPRVASSAHIKSPTKSKKAKGMFRSLKKKK